jgi:hypothetical protein
MSLREASSAPSIVPGLGEIDAVGKQPPVTFLPAWLVAAGLASKGMKTTAPAVVSNARRRRAGLMTSMRGRPRCCAQRGRAKRLEVRRRGHVYSMHWPEGFIPYPAGVKLPAGVFASAVDP